MLRSLQSRNCGAMTSDDEYPWLVADIGGTHARFGLVRAADGALEHRASLRCADFDSPQAAARAYLDGLGREAGVTPQLRRAAFALAAAVAGDTVSLTNSAWTVSTHAVCEALGLQELLLLNDFEALALALPRLRPDDVQLLGGGRVDRRQTMAVIGPGTGLGVAASIPVGDDRWLALATEGGHVTLAAADEFEAQVLSAARREVAHVSAERLLSGLGLPLLYRSLATVRGVTADAALAAADISARGLRGTDPLCAETIDLFCAMLGGFAGNVVLSLGARGGLCLAGGVALALREILPRSGFRARFEAKGRFRDYLAPVATALVVAPHAALAGAAQALADRR